MKRKEYVILLDGRPFFSVLDEAHIDVIRAEISLRFGDDAVKRVAVEVHTSSPYEKAGEDQFES